MPHPAHLAGDLHVVAHLLGGAVAKARDLDDGDHLRGRKKARISWELREIRKVQSEGEEWVSVMGMNWREQGGRAGK